MTNVVLDTSERADIQLLWEQLVVELADVFDAHGVCAAVASALAQYANSEVVVAIGDSVGRHYDVWICDRSGDTKQTRWRNHKPLLTRLSIEDGAALLYKRDVEPSELVISELWRLPQTTILAVPLPFPQSHHHITPRGAICIIDPPADCRLAADTIEPLASQVTVFLDRAFLRQRSDQQAIEFGTVSEISYSITSTLRLEEIFRQVTDEVRRALGAGRISIGLTDPVSNELVFVEATMGQIFRDLPPVRLKMGQGVAGWVALHGEPTIVNDPYADERFFSKVDQDSGFRTDSILCVPLQIEKRVIGVIEALNKHNGNFDDNDLRLLQAIGGPLAVAIENASLHTDVLTEKRRVETIFASMSEGLLTADKSGVVTAANDALLALLRRDAAAVYDQPILSIIKTRPSRFGDFIDAVMRGESDIPQLACDVHRGGEDYAPVLISATVTKEAEGEIDELIVVFSDLRQVREVERMRDDFFSNIVHELRTPLATILMYARLLREGKAEGDPEKASRFLGVVERESDRLQKMVRQMLLLAKLEAREFRRGQEPVVLNPIFDQILPPQADTATEKGLTFSQHIEPDLAPVMGNEDTLYMIVKNLVENAVKFTLSGTVEVVARTEDNSIRIEVRDQGIGIPEEAIPNLFQRFYRSRTAVERGIAGTGLGLYMVREGLENHGGTIEVSSKPGKGTTFSVRLPLGSADT